MTSIHAYRKHSTPHTIIQMALPDSQGLDDALHCTELCTLDGITYVAVPDGVTLPPQPAEIDVQPVVLTDALRDQIKAASPHVQLINARVAQAVAKRYSLSDEIKLLRTAPSPEMAAYNDYAEDCRAWGRAEKAKLGL